MRPDCSKHTDRPQAVGTNSLLPVRTKLTRRGFVPASLPVVVAGLLVSAPLIAEGQGIIRGRVVDESARPLSGVIVEVIGTRLGATTGVGGRYEVAGVPIGSHRMRCRGMGLGFAEQVVSVPGTEPVTVNWTLRHAAVPLADIVVTPGRTDVGRSTGLSTATLSKEVIATQPQLGEDVYRSLTRLPGVAASEYSSAFWVRGAPERELLTRLDGVDLVEPFHLKDFDAALSIVDVGTIGQIDLTSGGFTAEFGDRMTGVLSMKTIGEPIKGRQTSLGLSVTSARVSSQGIFAGGKGLWLAAARRGYLDLMLKLIQPKDDLSPRYYDVSTKVEYQLAASHRLSAHLLRAGDAVNFTSEGDPALTSHYGTTLGWLEWKAVYGRRLDATTNLSIGRLTWNRRGDGQFDIEHPLLLRDDRSATMVGLRQDWVFARAEGVLFKWGYGIERRKAEYGYHRENGEVFVRNDSLLTRTDSVRTTLAPEGTAAGLYGAVRVRPASRVTLEAGVRYDRNGYLKASRTSPRLNAAFDLGSSTTLRAAWGNYYQAPGIHEIQVQDGETVFRGVERAEQRTVGLDRLFRNGFAVRVEAYDRRYADLNPVYLNVRNTSLVFPEVEDDRIRLDRTTGRARGVELLVQRRAGGKLEWAGSYVHAIAEDRSGSLTVPRNRDQRHAVNLDMTYAPTPKWRMAWAWQYHTGWPYTEGTITFDTIPGRHFLVETTTYGPLNGQRVPPYHRLDLRVTRDFAMKKSTLRAFFDVFNAYRRKNVRGYDYFGRTVDGEVVVVRETKNMLPFLPSVGVSLDW